MSRMHMVIRSRLRLVCPCVRYMVPMAHAPAAEFMPMGMQRRTEKFEGQDKQHQPAPQLRRAQLALEAGRRPGGHRYLVMSLNSASACSESAD